MATEVALVHRQGIMDTLIIPPLVVVDCTWARRTREGWDLAMDRTEASEWGSLGVEVHQGTAQTVRCH